MLVTESRPRNLRWFHAGPLLYGDWGTSRLYVLGLAFLFTGHASVIYLLAIGALMIAVSWAYTIVCKSFPDGGGVYTAARQLSPTASVVGSTLLLSGYIMTAAISVVEAFHYFGVPEKYTLVLSLLTLTLIGGINWLGAKSAGRFALVVAFAALVVSAVMLVAAVPYFVEGLKTISLDYFTEHAEPAEAWVSFTRICLALAGVEAVANMSGLMTKPVEKTAKRTIWPVTIEVVVLNMVFGIALAGLSYSTGGVALVDKHVPDEIRLAEERAEVATLAGVSESSLAGMDAAALAALPEPVQERIGELTHYEEEVERYTNASMKVIAEKSGERMLGSATAGFVFGKIAGVTFGLLLLSATNTAVMAMVSVLFAMAQDRELPKGLTKLNYSGVPWVGLIVSMVIPAAVVAVERDVTVLAELYVLGVCGAITVTVGSVTLNKELDISRGARIGMGALALFLGAVSLTIAITEPVSTAFSGGLVAAVLGVRAIRSMSGVKPEPIPEPTTGWLAEATAAPSAIDPDKPKIMLAARGRYQAEFAVDLAKRRGGTLFVIYVRTLRLLDAGAAHAPKLHEDEAAQQALGSVALLAKANGVPFVPIYVNSTEIASEILDYTVTYGCDTLIMGKSRRSPFSRAVQGDVVKQVAESLPDEVALVTRSSETKHAHKLVVPGEPNGTASN